jgi:asparagine synthase (glutamine-hydrolysing)
MISYPLSAGNYLLELEKNLIYNEGQITLHGAAHLYAAISSLPLENFGILHSGQVGDAVLGSFLKTGTHVAPNIREGAYSTKLLHSLEHDLMPLLDLYPNTEIFLFYNRAFNAAINGDYACAVRSWSISPFLEIEFAQFCLNIDPRLRVNNQLYRIWIQQFNPLGASFNWEKTGSNLLVPEWYARYKNISLRAMRKIGRMISGKPNRYSMNPFDLWWRENPALPLHFNAALKQAEKLNSLLSPELLKDMLSLYENGNATDKLLAYSLMAGTKYLFEVE